MEAERGLGVQGLIASLVEQWSEWSGCEVIGLIPLF